MESFKPPKTRVAKPTRTPGRLTPLTLLASQIHSRTSFHSPGKAAVLIILLLTRIFPRQLEFPFTPLPINKHRDTVTKFPKVALNCSGCGLFTGAPDIAVIGEQKFLTKRPITRSLLTDSPSQREMQYDMR